MIKKIVSVLLIVVCLVAFAACGNNYSYEYGPVTGGASASDVVSDNGSFVVTKGDYIYYINSLVGMSGTNTFGEVLTGALCRANKDGSNATVILPKLVANTNSTGLYIFGDRIYFTSPCDEIDADGKVQYSYLDVLSVKLDGTDCVKHATLGASNYPMTFMESNGSVYLVYVKSNVLNSLDLNAKKAETKELSSDYAAYVFADDKVIVSKLAYAEGSDTVKDRYSVVCAISPDGTETELFNGNNVGNVKYKYSVISYNNGVLYYEKSDSVLTLEDSLCKRNITGTSASSEVKVLETYTASFVPYSVNGESGIIASIANVGTIKIADNGEKKILLTTALSNMYKVVDDNLYYTVAGTDVIHVYKYDLKKLFNGEEAKAEQLFAMVNESGTATYDGLVSTNFTKPVISGGYVYYYSVSQSAAKSLYKWSVSDGTFTLVSKAA